MYVIKRKTKKDFIFLHLFWYEADLILALFIWVSYCLPLGNCKPVKQETSSNNRFGHYAFDITFQISLCKLLCDISAKNHGEVEKQIMFGILFLLQDQTCYVTDKSIVQKSVEFEKVFSCCSFHIFLSSLFSQNW